MSLACAANRRAFFQSVQFFCSEDDKNVSRRVVRRHRRPRGDWLAACAFEGKATIQANIEVSTKRTKNRHCCGTLVMGQFSQLLVSRHWSFGARAECRSVSHGAVRYGPEGRAKLFCSKGVA